MSQGFQTTARLRTLRPVLEEWIGLNISLGREWQSAGAAPWWYNERALLSVFAGAVWRTGGSALEEYSVEKRTDRRVAYGRIDIWFSNGRQDFVAEAKACQIPFTRSSRKSDRTAADLERAKADIRRCNPDGWTRRLAILFGQPYIRPCRRDQMKRRIEWLVEHAGKIDHDALAWVFPKQRSLPIGNNWVSPGAMIWIKEVRR